MNAITTSLIKETCDGYHSLTIDNLLLTSRRVFFTGQVDEESCDSLLKALIALNDEDPQAEIKLFINSPGGEVSSGLAVYDYIRFMECPLTTICVGTAASMGALLFLAGERRLVTEHSRIMIHDPSYGGGSLAGMKPHELDRIAKDLKKIRDVTGEIIAEVTGRPLKEILKITKEDRFYDAAEAVEFGLASEIIKKGVSL